jgi:hypothetical protein
MLAPLQHAPGLRSAGFSAFALLLFQMLRTLALPGTELTNATAGTIR